MASGLASKLDDGLSDYFTASTLVSRNLYSFQFIESADLCGRVICVSFSSQGMVCSTRCFKRSATAVTLARHGVSVIGAHDVRQSVRETGCNAAGYHLLAGMAERMS